MGMKLAPDVAKKVLAAAGANGLTDEELRAKIGRILNSVAPRRVELVRAGLIVDSGRTRMTANGCQKWESLGFAGRSIGDAVHRYVEALKRLVKRRKSIDIKKRPRPDAHRRQTH